MKAKPKLKKIPGLTVEQLWHATFADKSHCALACVGFDEAVEMTRTLASTLKTEVVSLSNSGASEVVVWDVV